MNSSSFCAPNGDSFFGPQVEPCIRSFDFTIRFENVVLSIAPSAILLIITPVRLLALRNQKRKVVGGSTFQVVKLLTIALFGILQLALLVLWCLNPVERSPAAVSAATLTLIDTVALCFLSYVEHGRNIRPSAIIGTYLFFSLIFDIIRVRTLWLIGQDTNEVRIFTTSVVLKVCILCMEVKEKRDYLAGADKLRSPEELSGILSQGVYYWLNQLIMQGYGKILSLEDLYPLDEKLSSRNLSDRFCSNWDRSGGPSKHRLLFETAITFKWELLAPVLPRLVLIAFTMCQPLLLNRFVGYLSALTGSETANVGYGLIAAYGVVYLGLAISAAFYSHRNYRFVTIIRGSLVTAIYRKTTEISLTALDNSAAVTLMSTDVERIINGLRMMHEFWANLVQVCIATWLLQRELGVACVAPIAISMASMIGAFCLSNTAGKKQVEWMKHIQKRIGITSTMLSSMKGVKMAGLTQSLTEIIQNLRIAEVLSGYKFRMMVVWNLIFAFAPLHLSPVISFAAFAAINHSAGESLDAARMFTSLSLLSLLTQPLSQSFQRIPTFLAAVGCFQRIQAFLETETKSDHRLMINRISSNEVSQELGVEGNAFELQPLRPVGVATDSIIVRNGTFGWNSSDGPVLKDTSFSIRSFGLTMIIGPVACGKSTLLKALLGETPSSQGFVYVSTTEMAFCDQTPWLINGSIQKNILGFSNFDGPWYNAVLHACALEEDLSNFPMGDQSLVGSKGITLSGGQKQRLAIARAVYSKKSIIILDDVFSGMDVTTEHLVFNRLLGSEGLLRINGCTVIIATHAINLLPSADYIIALGSNGSIVEQGSFKELNRSNGYVRSFLVHESKQQPQDTKPAVTFSLAPMPTSSLVNAMDDKKRQLGDLSVYMYYFRTLGKTVSFLFIFFAVAHGFFFSFPTVWLKWWSDANSGKPTQNVLMYLGVYSVFEVAAVVFLGLLVWHCFTTMIIKSGLKLHWITLTTVTSAPMALFSTVDTGVLVNRFSQDMELVDNELPSAVMNLGGSLFICVGQAILIATATFYIALVYPFIAAIFYFIQKFYLRTSRQLRFMDLEAKSPLYTQFIESLSGLATIRAFGWQQNERDLNLQLLDTSQKPFYLLFMIQQWLTLVLELVAMCLALVVTGLAVKLRDVVSPGFTGVALVQIIGFNITLQSLVIWWTVMETSIGAVSRVKAFSTDTKSEALPNEIVEPPGDWPPRGLIEFKDISASYKSIDNKALQNFSLTIRPGEKFGICGRSGSGKSSLILTMFRMLELNSGSIFIDGIDLSTLPRHYVRKNLNAIPQDPYFVTGSIRLNLDPYSTSTDDLIMSALSKVHLLNTITLNGGLDSELDPDTLSHGQRQLFCLARAILRKSKIVVLDEATSSVDRETDKLMQKIIRQEFKDCTIIAVAHRLETILDFDRIAVLDRGQLIECGSPESLLAAESALKELYDVYSSSKEETDDSRS
ncbi:canalicular multispecific organic anion transporter 1 [Stipitochalara longipes BDJ]|nr:canalicular multispecific organic anion transporter 1 [Stipitochalara longipes BDJ]